MILSIPYKVHSVGKPLSMQAELALLARGQTTHFLPEAIATWALDHMHALEFGVFPVLSQNNDEVRWLEKLHSLEDTRHA